MTHLPPFLHSLPSILPALIVFGVLIIVHEFGHFIACRFSKVRVEKFSIGFGPELLHWQSGETRFSISLFPLGGFVSPAGEEASKVGPEGPKPGDFLAAPVLSRIFIVVSGVAMNYVLGYTCFNDVTARDLQHLAGIGRIITIAANADRLRAHLHLHE